MSAYRACCELDFLQVMGLSDWAVPARAEIEVEYRVHRGAKVAWHPREWQPYHPKDEDNARASLKAAVDALKDAGVIASDAKARLRWGEFRLFTTLREVEKHGRVGVTIIVRKA